MLVVPQYPLDLLLTQFALSQLGYLNLVSLMKSMSNKMAKFFKQNLEAYSLSAKHQMGVISFFLWKILPQLGVQTFTFPFFPSSLNSTELA